MRESRNQDADDYWTTRQQGKQRASARHRCERSMRVHLLPRVIHQSNVENNGQIPFALAASYLEHAIITSLRISGSFHLYLWVDDNPRLHACTDSFPGWAVLAVSSLPDRYVDKPATRLLPRPSSPLFRADWPRFPRGDAHRRRQRSHDNLPPYIMYATLQFASGSTCTYRISLEWNGTRGE